MGFLAKHAEYSSSMNVKNGMGTTGARSAGAPQKAVGKEKRDGRRRQQRSARRTGGTGSRIGASAPLPTEKERKSKTETPPRRAVVSRGYVGHDTGKERERE
ncbi:uncharacterized protein LOC143218727 [Lasioglossum baleicum]|uniref:uncharacterized protein LOC143218727 n=1 Tax=Lasioglossum baleicum TaxID=434251 RepID=UPI003FCE7B76